MKLGLLITENWNPIEINFSKEWNLLQGTHGSDSKESTCDAGDSNSSHGSGRSPGGGQGNPIQYSRLENSVDRRAWWVIVHGVADSWTWLSD